MIGSNDWNHCIVANCWIGIKSSDFCCFFWKQFARSKRPIVSMLNKIALLLLLPLMVDYLVVQSATQSLSSQETGLRCTSARESCPEWSICRKDYYTNDSRVENVRCYCNLGYIWNGTQCALQQCGDGHFNCSAHFPNTECRRHNATARVSTTAITTTGSSVNTSSTCVCIAKNYTLNVQLQSCESECTTCNITNLKIFIGCGIASIVFLGIFFVYRCRKESIQADVVVVYSKKWKFFWQ